MLLVGLLNTSQSVFQGTLRVCEDAQEVKQIPSSARPTPMNSGSLKSPLIRATLLFFLFIFGFIRFNLKKKYSTAITVCKNYSCRIRSNRPNIVR